MEITEYQANMLRALADRKTLQAIESDPDIKDRAWFEIANLDSAVLFINSSKYVVRIKPDVIIVNGIEVPAPEKVAPKAGTVYFFPVFDSAVFCAEDQWDADGHLERTWDKRRLDRGLVFLQAGHAEAMARAMLAHKPG